MKKLFVLLIAGVMLLGMSACREYGKSYEKGQSLMREGQYEEAIRKYRLAVSQGMKDPAVYADLAIAYEKNGESGEADAALEEALEKGADDPAVMKKCGIFSLMRSQDATALQYFRNSVQSDENDLSGEDLETMGYIADIYKRAGAFQEAIRIYNLLITQGYCTLEHEILAGECYLRLVQNQAACQYFEMAVSNPRAGAEHYVAIVRMLDEAGDRTDAELFYQRGAAFTEEEGKMSRGTYCYSCGRIQEAYEYLASEDDEESRLLRASELCDSQDYDAAERIYEEMIRDGYDSGKVYNAYMMLKIAQGEYTAARQLLMKVQSDENPAVRSDGAWNEVILYERMQDFDTARERLRSYSVEHYLNEEERHELLFLTGE